LKREETNPKSSPGTGGFDESGTGSDHQNQPHGPTTLFHGESDDILGLMRSLLDNMSEGVIVVEEGVGVIVANPMAMSILGDNISTVPLTGLAERYGVRRSDGVTPATDEDLAIIRALRDGSTSKSEVVVRNPHHPTGRVLSTFGRPLPPAPSGARRAVCVFHDITEHRQAESRMLEMEQHYRTLAEASPALIFLAQPDGSAEYFNRRWLEYTGLSMEEARGTGWLACIHPDERPELESAWQMALVSGEPIELRLRLLRAFDCEYRLHVGSISAVRDGLGHVSRWFFTCTDVEDQQNLERWLQSMLNLLPVATIFLDPVDAHFTFANRAARHLLAGASGEELTAQQLGERFLCLGEEGQPMLPDQCPPARVARGERLDGIQAVWGTANAPRNLLVYGDRLPSMFGSPATGILVLQDITDLKKVEDQLRNKQHELLRSNEALQEFAYVVSHDLQEPLRMVSGYTQLLQRRYAGKLDASADEYLGYLNDGANRMSQLIKDLLAFSRAGGSLDRVHQQVSMQNVLQWAMLNLQAAIEETHAEITHDEMPIVRGDEPRLAQVMQNLIGNAIKYRGDEPPRIHIGVHPKEDHWEFCVQDNGIGFEMRFSERIFGVFKRLHGKTYPGTGIGLAITKRIIDAHGGRIWAESEPGKGSTFFFTLPP
jgi:PAS domain S-box-containing protein